MSDNVEIEVTILEIVDDAFPIWLSFELIDRHGVQHRFIDKAPVILGADTPVPSSFPKRAYISFALAERNDEYVIVHMQEPEGLVSSEGDILFEIPINRIKPDRTDGEYTIVEEGKDLREDDSCSK